MTPATLERAALLDWQRRFLRAYAGSDLAGHTYLSGGTALAGFYLGHRVSDDLDFFGNDEVPLFAIEALLDRLDLTRRSYERLYDRKIFLLDASGAAVKVEFARFPFPHCEPPRLLEGGVRIDGVLDIFVNKLHAMVDRDEGKDDVDVYFLLQQQGLPTLPRLIELCEQKFGVTGLEYSLQRRLLRVPETLPSTTPRVPRDEVSATFRRQAEALARRSMAK